MVNNNILLFSQELQSQLLAILTPDNVDDILAASDRAFNIFPLQPTYQYLFDSCLFRLKWLGDTGETVDMILGGKLTAVASYCVQLFWLPHRVPQALQRRFKAAAKKTTTNRRLISLEAEDISSLATELETELADAPMQLGLA
jgi:hypothetical protein